MKLLSAAVAGAACVSAIHVEHKSPLTSTEKAAVGNALTSALSVLKGDAKGGSKFSSCLSLFPQKQQGKESDALWAACKDQFAAGLLEKNSASSTTAMVNMYDMTRKEDPAPAEKPAKKEYNAEEYSEDWGTEHKSEEYPDKSKGLQHHPGYDGKSSAGAQSTAVAFVTMVAGALLL